MREDRIRLPAMSLGSERHLGMLRYGEPGARPKAYLQTGLHADELPGMLVMHHLRQRLDELDAGGAIRGEIVLVPVANPIGLGQHLHGHLLGRYELDSGDNFNRGYRDLAPAIAERIGGDLGADAGDNVALIRAAALALLAEPPAGGDNAFLKHVLLREAVDADICLDLHCDWEAVLHVYLGTALWPAGRDLCAQLGSRTTMTATVSGGHPFDESVGGLWWTLAERFPDHPIPPACLSATVELRGERDLDDDTARADADNLVRFLVRRLVIDGDPGPLPALPREATPLEGVDNIRCSRPGVVVYHREPGDRVEAGEPIATVVDPMAAPGSAREELSSRVSGILFARRSSRLARPGLSLVRVAGTEPLPEKIGQHLLTD